MIPRLEFTDAMALKLASFQPSAYWLELLFPGGLIFRVKRTSLFIQKHRVEMKKKREWQAQIFLVDKKVETRV